MDPTLRPLDNFYLGAFISNDCCSIEEVSGKTGGGDV